MDSVFVGIPDNIKGTTLDPFCNLQIGVSIDLSDDGEYNGNIPNMTVFPVKHTSKNLPNSFDEIE